MTKDVLSSISGYRRSERAEVNDPIETVTPGDIISATASITFYMMKYRKVCRV